MKKVFALLMFLVAFSLFNVSRPAVAAETAAHTIRWTDVYKAPNGDRVGGVALPPNTTVTIVSTSQDMHWLNVTSEVANGWIPTNATSAGGAPAGGGSTPTPAPVPSGDATEAWLNVILNPDASAEEVSAVFDPDGDGVWESPELPYSPATLYIATIWAQSYLRQAGGLLDRVSAGSNESCAEYITWIQLMLLAPVFTDVPESELGLVEYYNQTFAGFVESQKDLIFYCIEGGSISPLNFGIARVGVNTAVDRLHGLRRELERRYPELLELYDLFGV